MVPRKIIVPRTSKYVILNVKRRLKQSGTVGYFFCPFGIRQRAAREHKRQRQRQQQQQQQQQQQHEECCRWERTKNVLRFHNDNVRPVRVLCTMHFSAIPTPHFILYMHQYLYLVISYLLLIHVSHVTKTDQTHFCFFVLLCPGVTPRCDQYLELWPPGFETYNVMVPNLFDIPFCDFGVGTLDPDVRSISAYVTSRYASYFSRNPIMTWWYDIL